MRKIGLGLAGVCALGMASAANAQQATITYSGTTAIPAVNNFQSELAGLGLTQYTSTGATISLTDDAVITFEFLGSESGYSDTFSTVSVLPLSYTENSTLEDHFGAPITIGSTRFTAGDLLGLLNFTTSGAGGMGATVGDNGFGIFLGPNATSSGSFNTNVFYLGYDDQITNTDDNHDDFIVRATVTPVPEPATWAMMLLGFGAIGYSMRRRTRAAGLPQLA